MSRKLFVLFAFTLFSYAALALTTFERYFHDSYRSLESMRNHKSGLVIDSMRADLAVLNDSTSPSNIGLDLLVQLEAMRFPSHKETAKINIRKILSTIKVLPYHHASGLFFSRYASDGKTVDQLYLSTVDNIHLAFAVWVVSKTFPEATPRNIAAKILKRFHFQPFYSLSSGLFAGGMYPKNGKWILESWHYDYFGSEGRSIYTIGNALKLFHDKDFPKKTLRSLKIEMKGDLLRMWDGGAFQLLLPRLLVNEGMYSPKLEKAFHAYAKFVLSEKERKGLPVPASYSACQTSIDDYNGKSGSTELVATFNADLNDRGMFERWDQVFTPHAAMLVAPMMPDEFEQAMLESESLGIEQKLYIEGLGWLDGLHLKGKEKGQVVPVFLSLDQTMIALSAAQILSRDQMTVGNRVIWRDDVARSKIKKFYHAFDKIRQMPN